MQRNVIGGALLFLSTLLLGACGGGSGDGAPNSAGSPEGVYEGTTSGGASHTTLVLDDNRFYSIYGEESADAFYITGLLQGNGVANNGSFTSTNVRDYFYDGTVLSGTLSATYRAGESFDGTFTDGTNTATFTGTPLTGSSYNYGTAANLSNVTGSWTLDSMQGDTLSLIIQADGSFSAVLDACSFNGTVLPRVSGKNVFDVNFTFGAAPCPSPGQAFNGIALEYQMDGIRQLIVAGTILNRNYGTAWFGAR